MRRGERRTRVPGRSGCGRRRGVPRGVLKGEEVERTLREVVDEEAVLDGGGPLACWSGEMRFPRKWIRTENRSPVNALSDTAQLLLLLSPTTLVTETTDTMLIAINHIVRSTIRRWSGAPLCPRTVMIGPRQFHVVSSVHGVARVGKLWLTSYSVRIQTLSAFSRRNRLNIHEWLGARPDGG